MGKTWRSLLKHHQAPQTRGEPGERSLLRKTRRGTRRRLSPGHYDSKMMGAGIWGMLAGVSDCEAESCSAIGEVMTHDGVVVVVVVC